jgi:hypothetical protein
VEFDTNFQELMKFEQGAHVCTWIIDQVLKQNLEFQLGEFFLDSLPEFDSDLFEVGFGLFRVWLNHLIDAGLRA